MFKNQSLDDMSAMETILLTNSQSATILWFMLQAVEKRTRQNFLKLSTSAGKTIFKKH